MGNAKATVILRRATADYAAIIQTWREEPSARRFQPLHQLSLAELRRQLAERAAFPLSPQTEGKPQ